MMPDQPHQSAFSLAKRIKQWLAALLPSANGNRPCRKRIAYSRKPLWEMDILENRLAPAVLTNPAPGVLLIDLNNANEQIQIESTGLTYSLISTHNFTGTATGFTGYGSTNGTLNPTGLTKIQITDSQAGTSVTFNNSGLGEYTPLFDINLDNTGAGAVTFNGRSNFSGGLSVRDLAAGITSDALSMVNIGVPFFSAADLFVQTTGNINLKDLTVTGAASLDANSITLANDSAFGTMNAAAATLVSRNGGIAVEVVQARAAAP